MYILIGLVLVQLIITAFVAKKLFFESEIKEHVEKAMTNWQEAFFTRHSSSQTEMKSDVLNTLLQTLKLQHDQSSTNIKNLTDTVQKRLHDISKEVTQELGKGFEKNQAVYHSVIKRLSLIDQAQERITQLSQQITGLNDILTDKSSRGALGEVQLEQLVANIIPPHHFRLQETLPNGKRVDCLLLMPSQGHIAIDAKFPLENYQKQFIKSESQKQTIALFKQDIKKHIDDISSRYIIPNFTMDGADRKSVV